MPKVSFAVLEPAATEADSKGNKQQQEKDRVNIIHAASTRAVLLRESYLYICAGCHCSALLLELLDMLTQRGQIRQVKRTVPEFVNDLFGVYQRDSLLGAIKGNYIHNFP